jgi:D-alanyl-lipoteichoic acid acyltransferase DltB (MBOAT superfamily)
MTTKIIYFGYHISNGSSLPLLEYLGYIFFFPGVLIGPTLSVDTYIKFINLSDNYKNIVYSASSVYKNIFNGIIMAVLTVVLVPRFPPDWSLTS